MIWRLITSWLTLGVGGAIFYSWVRKGLKALDSSPVPAREEAVPAG
jgi:hypothetical protein